MKKIISIQLSFLILLSTIGFSINTHYCANKATSSFSFTIPHSCCGEKKMPSNCCKNVSKFVQLKQNGTPIQNIQIPSPILFESILFFVQLYNSLLENEQNFSDSIHKSPPLISIPFTILHSVFLI